MAFPRSRLRLVVIFIIIVSILFLVNLDQRCYQYVFEKKELQTAIKCKPQYPNFYPKTTCLSQLKINIQKSNMNTSAFFSYPALATKKLQKLVAERHHGNFMPVLNVQMKTEIMYLYLVVRDAFISRNIEHFLVNGAVLGIFRHGGLVPWDHDIDLGVFVDHRQEVDDALSCIKGFTLAWSSYRSNFHAIFRYTGREVPLIDLYIYGFDDHYVYGLNSKDDMIYPLRSVFPLQETFVEGVPFYVPRDISATKFQYDPKICKLGSILYSVNKSWAAGYPDAFSLTSVNCSELTYMYTFKPLTTE